MVWVKSMPGDVGDFSVNIGLGINFLAFVSQFVTLRDTLTYGVIQNTVYLYTQSVFVDTEWNFTHRVKFYTQIVMLHSELLVYAVLS